MNSNIKTLTATTAGQMLENGHMMQLIDVRTSAEFRDGHAHGAVNIPLDTISADQLQLQFPDW